MSRSDYALYRPHELAFRTQYAELKDRSQAMAALLPGSPGSLVKRAGTGRAYWYRVYQTAVGTQVEDLVCKDGSSARGARVCASTCWPMARPWAPSCPCPH